MSSAAIDPAKAAYIEGRMRGWPSARAPRRRALRQREGSESLWLSARAAAELAAAEQAAVGSGEADESLWSCPSGSEAASKAPEEQQQMGKKGKNVLARAFGKFGTKHQEIYTFKKN